MTLRPPGRRAALGVVVLTAAAFGAGGLVGSRWIRSPQEAAATREPPPASVLTAAVERRILTDTLVARGDVVVGRRLDVSLQGAADARPLVTGVRVRTGDRVRAGRVVVEVSGRPVFVLPGRVPAYRDLRPEAEGRDVLQLQRALRSLGVPVGSDRAGILGAGTQEALTTFYERIGYTVPTTGDEGEVAEASDAVTAARRAVTAAREILHRTRSEPADPEDPRGHGYAVRDARTALRLALEDEHKAAKKLAAVRAKSGPMLPLNEVVFVPALPATVARTAVAAGSPADGTALSLDLGAPRVVVMLDPSRRALVQIGMALTVGLDAGRDDLACRIARIGAETADGSGGLAHPVSITCPALPRSSVGSNVLVRAVTASTGTPALVVPVAALTTRGDGTTIVTVQSSDGDERDVAVRAGLSASGYVEVDGDLDEGERVVIGSP